MIDLTVTDSEEEDSEEEEGVFIPQSRSPEAGPSRLCHRLDDDSSSDEEEEGEFREELHGLATRLGDHLNRSSQQPETPYIAHLPAEEPEDSDSDDGQLISRDVHASSEDEGLSEDVPMSISTSDLGTDQGFVDHENERDLQHCIRSAEDEERDRSRAMSISEGDRSSVHEDVDELDGLSSHSRDSSQDADVLEISHILVAPPEESRSPPEAELRSAGSSGSRLEHVPPNDSQNESTREIPSSLPTGGRTSLQRRLASPDNPVGDQGLDSGGSSTAAVNFSLDPRFTRSSLRGRLRSPSPDLVCSWNHLFNFVPPQTTDSCSLGWFRFIFPNEIVPEELTTKAMMELRVQHSTL